jgi:hypothetical protein
MPRSDAEFQFSETLTGESAVPRTLLALGPYRSGLTPLTGLLRFLGADITIEDEGFALRKVYDDIGHAACVDWNDCHSVVGVLQSAPATRHLDEEALGALRARFATSKLFVLHDPRICRSLPFWRSVIAAFGARALAVLMVRHPFDVMDSLRRHYGCAPPTSCLLWLRYVLDAENASRDLPRAVVTYDGLLADWSGTASRLQIELGVRWPTRRAPVDLEIAQFFREPTRRHEIGGTELAPDAKDWLLETYSALAHLSREPGRTERLVRLNHIRLELDRAFAIFRPLLFDPEAELAHCRDRDRSDCEDFKNAGEEMRHLYFELKESELFDWQWYLQAYPDVRDSNSDPLLHYLKYGAKEARAPNHLFGTDWYLGQNPDVKEAGLNPLAHYLLYGAAEGRDPSPLFDTDWYIQQYPDVAAAGLNPLAHYLQYGRAQGRQPKPPA